MNMEFLYPNYLDTTTSVSCSTGSASASYLFDRRPRRQFTSVGDNDDTTSTTITISFLSTQTVDRIVLQNINWREFQVYTATTTSLITLGTTTAGTTTASWTGNSSTNLFFALASSTAMTSLTFRVTKTISANEEKKAGQIWVSERSYQFARNPKVEQYQPKVYNRDIKLEMAEGGTSVYRIRDKMKVRLNMDYRTDRTSVDTIYARNESIVFCPFPTGTSYDGYIWEMNVIGGLDIFKPSGNFTPSGYDISINLEETPS